VIGIVVVLLVIAGVLIFNSQKISPTSEELKDSNPGVYLVLIKNFEFSPSELTIKVGETVRWINQDSIKHTVTSDLGSELDSDLLGNGASYSHTFNSPGEFPYHCILHPSMIGKVIVQ